VSLRRRSRAARFFAETLVLFLGILSVSSSAYANTVRKDQSEVFYQSTPLTYTPGRGTPAVAAAAGR